MPNMSLATAGALVVYDYHQGGRGKYTVRIRTGVAWVLDGNLNVYLGAVGHNQQSSRHVCGAE